MNNMEIRRGDIYNVQNGGRFSGGTTISGFRPAVIVSNNTGNHFSNCVEVVYLTTQDKKPLPTHAPVMGKVPSTALCEQINTVGKDKLGEYIRTCSAEEMRQIDAALLVSLGLTPPRMVEKHVGGGTMIEPQRADLVKMPRKPENVPRIEPEDVVKLKAERDTYKHMCERLLTLITER